MDEVKKAIKVILGDKKSLRTFPVWFINSCYHTLWVDDPGKMQQQVMFILGNIMVWSHPEARNVRTTLRNFLEA